MWLLIPAEAVDEKADGKGAEHPSHGEDGHGERPQCREGGLRDGLRVAMGPRLIVEALDDLTHKAVNDNRAGLQQLTLPPTPPTHLACSK